MTNRFGYSKSYGKLYCYFCKHFFNGFVIVTDGRVKHSPCPICKKSTFVLTESEKPNYDEFKRLMEETRRK